MLRLLVLLTALAAGMVAFDQALAVSTGGYDAPVSTGVSAQEGDVGAAEDTRLPVQVWTVLAAVGAACVGLLFFLVRLVMGWVKPAPPPQEEGGH